MSRARQSTRRKRTRGRTGDDPIVGVGFIQGFRAGWAGHRRKKSTKKTLQDRGDSTPMGQAESKLSRDIMRELRLRGWFCFKVHGSETMMAGLPDIIVCAEGKFIGLETKMPTKRTNTSAAQENVHYKIKNAGGVAVVVTSPAEAVAAVQRAL